ncbi:hypothetical protein BVRB_1g011050 [Beta vulgaris subsp. vulgaris]|nr:hypothetical protein BVRB_1g011050 [Beta vulgaris subsp. vulgaris]
MKIHWLMGQYQNLSRSERPQTLMNNVASLRHPEAP